MVSGAGAGAVAPLDAMALLRLPAAGLPGVESIAGCE